jgi:hypothetical protein
MLSSPRALAELKAQHDMLRAMMDRCEDLADELEAGRCGPTQLMREVMRLRLAFDAHNKYEEQLLKPVLLQSHSSEATERILAGHIEEHRDMRRDLAGPETTMLRGVLAAMRAHLEVEERYLLAARTITAAAK